MLGTFPETLNLRTWQHHGVHDKEIDPVIILLNDESFISLDAETFKTL
jgi:predicted Rossmann-fold nucleotide-binding protein